MTGSLWPYNLQQSVSDCVNLTWIEQHIPPHYKHLNCGTQDPIPNSDAQRKIDSYCTFLLCLWLCNSMNHCLEYLVLPEQCKPLHMWGNTVSKSLRHLFQPNSKFVKSLKRFITTFLVSLYTCMYWDPHRQLCVTCYAVRWLCCTYHHPVFARFDMPVNLLSANHGNAWTVLVPGILGVGGVAGGGASQI